MAHDRKAAIAVAADEDVPDATISKARVEAFSDGVIAVAITILALDLHVPDPAGHGSLLDHLGDQWPSYAAYVVSFLTIGIIWINHHAMLRRLVRVDHTIMVLNVVLLLTIGLLPFSTALMAQYLRASQGQNVAAVVYGGSFLVLSIVFFTMQRHLLIAKQHLLQSYLTAEVRRSVLRRNAFGLLPYTVATLGGILTPYLTLAICAVLAVFYGLPTTTSDLRATRTRQAEAAGGRS